MKFSKIVPVINTLFIKKTTKKAIKNDPYAWQHTALLNFQKTFKEDKHQLVVAPTGAGKSATISLCADYVVKQGYKVIVVTPKCDISSQFNKNIINGIEWNYELNTANDSNNDSNVEKVCDFLNSKRGTNNVFVTTHQTLGLFCDKYEFPNIKLLLIVDEAHHGSTVSSYDLSNSDNKLGSIYKKFTKNNNHKLLLITATPFRSDHKPVIEEELFDKFNVYKFYFHEMMSDKNMRKYLERVEYHHVFYKKNNFYKSIKELSTEQDCCIYYVPATVTINTNGHAKNEYVENLIQQLYGTRYKRNGSIITLNNGKLVIDLVTDMHDRTEGIKKLNELNKKTPCMVSGIIAMNMFKEGSDFASINKIFNLSAVNSLVDVLQRFGRGTRDYKDKNKVVCYQMIEERVFIVDNVMEETQQALKTIVLSMACSEFFMQLNYQFNNEKNTTSSFTSTLNPVEEVYRDEQDALSFKEKIIMKINDYFLSSGGKKELDNAKNRAEKIESKIEEFVISQLRSDNKAFNEDKVKDIVVYIKRSIVRLKLTINGIDVSKIKLDMLDKQDVSDFFEVYLSKQFTSDKLKEYKECVDAYRASCSIQILNLDETVAYMKQHEFSGQTQWYKHKEENPNIGIAKTCWLSFGLTYKEFWSLVNGNIEQLSKEEAIAYMKQHEISGRTQWYKHKEENPNIGISKKCWQSFGLTYKEFWSLVNGNTEQLSKEEAIAYMKQHEFSGQTQWYKHKEENPNIGIAKTCWRSFGLTYKEFWSLVNKG